MPVNPRSKTCVYICICNDEHPPTHQPTHQPPAPIHSFIHPFNPHSFCYPPPPPHTHTNAPHRAFGDQDDDFGLALAPFERGEYPLDETYTLLGDLASGSPNLEVLSLRGCDLDPHVTFEGLTHALKPWCSRAPTQATIEYKEAQLKKTGNTGPVLLSSSPILHICQAPRLARLDLRGNGLDLAWRRSSEEADEIAAEAAEGPVPPLVTLRRAFRRRREFGKRWNELQRLGKDGRVAPLQVLV